jgi:hypothetical protein
MKDVMGRREGCSWEGVGGRGWGVLRVGWCWLGRWNESDGEGSGEYFGWLVFGWLVGAGGARGEPE